MPIQAKRFSGPLLTGALVLSIGAAAASDPPPLYDARHILRQSHPEMATFAKEARPLIAEANDTLFAAEQERRGVTCARQALVELRWRINSTVDVSAARENMERLKAALADLASSSSHEANVLAQDGDGSFGSCDTQWFFKLDDSSSELLDHGVWRGKVPPRFLERVNSPASLIAYLERIILSDFNKESVDHRKELNASTGVLARVVLRGGIAGYLAQPEFRTAFRAFLDMWQDPTTGFFGEWYVDRGRIIKTADLSVTFHMARYTKGRIGHWPELIDTLLAIKDRPYPQGWLDDDGMTNHNNYDVAELFRLGWPHMSEGQRDKAKAEIARMLDWSLTHSISADGEIARTGAGEPLGDMYYFAAAFLDTIGYFDKRKRFWTTADFPQSEALRVALEAKAKLIAPDAPFAQSALGRLATPVTRDQDLAAVIPNVVIRSQPIRPFPVSGWMDVRSTAAHEYEWSRRTESVGLAHIEERLP